MYGWSTLEMTRLIVTCYSEIWPRSEGLTFVLISHVRSPMGMALPSLPKPPLDIMIDEASHSSSSLKSDLTRMVLTQALQAVVVMTLTVSILIFFQPVALEYEKSREAQYWLRHIYQHRGDFYTSMVTTAR